MDAQDFGTQARFRICLSCGHPFPVVTDGEEASCPSCGTPVRVAPRRLEPLAPPEAFAETPQQWQERIATLRRQMQSYNRDNKYSFVTAPEGLEEIGKNDADQLQGALLQRIARCEERGRASGPQERAVFWLACRLRSAVSATEQAVLVAAVLHTALDVLSDKGFRHGILCRLARLATANGHLEAAEAWLALCDPVSTILDLDSDYRLARALTTAAQGRWAEVLVLVGDDEWAVPHEPASVILLTGLRGAALEGLGRGFEAEEVMKGLAKTAPVARPHETLKKIFEDNGAFHGALAAWIRADPEGFSVGGTGLDADGVVVPGAKSNAGFGVSMIIMMVVSFALIGLGVYFLGQYQVEHAYKKTTGQLVEVTSRSVGRGKKAKIRVYVHYRYTVAGKTYPGRYVETGQSYYLFGSDRSADRKIRELKGRRSFPVYYDAKKPSRAILERQNAALHMVPFVVAGMIWVTVLVILRIFLKRRRRYREKLAEAQRAEAEAAGESGAPS